VFDREGVRVPTILEAGASSKPTAQVSDVTFDFKISRFPS
jgi:hypothetical protein